MPTNNQAAATDFLARAPLLATVREASSGMDASDRIAFARQLQVLLRDYYVHLPLKRSSLGIDPVQEAALLADEAAYFSGDADYFARLLDLMNRLRDRHTAVRLPSPWRSMVAFLPFALESCFDAAGRHLLVSKTMTDLGDPRFVPGVEITHWNGSPIRRFVESLSMRSAGGNPFARIAVTLRSLTARPLGYMLAPDEDWVVLNFRSADGTTGTVVCPWLVYMPPETGTNPGGSNLSLASARGLDSSTLQVNGAWLDLFSQRGGDATLAATADPLSNVARWRSVRTARGEWGYIRLFSFDAPDPAAFVRRFAEVLATMPPDGLVIDLRANPGGTIPAGEALMALFTEDDVSPQPVSFRNTPAVRPLGGLPLFSRWRRSLEMQLETGEIFTQGYALGADQSLPRSFIYRGKVVLIIDALCYSTTDFFVAGMQDNGLATLIGTDPVTGAGGANVWNHATLRSFLDAAGGGHGLEALPVDLDIDVSMRRSIRVGRNDGLPVEGAGVFAERSYLLTRGDVLGSNDSLVEYACEVLADLRDAARH